MKNVTANFHGRNSWVFFHGKKYQVPGGGFGDIYIYIFLNHPEIWGFHDPILPKHIFQMGWSETHQLEFLEVFSTNIFFQEFFFGRSWKLFVFTVKCKQSKEGRWTVLFVAGFFFALWWVLWHTFLKRHFSNILHPDSREQIWKKSLRYLYIFGWVGLRKTSQNSFQLNSLPPEEYVDLPVLHLSQFFSM